MGSKGAAAGIAAALLTAALVGVVATGASADVTKGVKPDFVLSPHQAPIIRHVNSILANDLTPQVKDYLVPTADECRNDPEFDHVCDVYRIKVNRSMAPGAINQVFFFVDYETDVYLGDFDLVAAGLGAGYVPDLDLFVYDKPNHFLDYNNVGGRGVEPPERVSWDATQDAYDVVVRVGTGATNGYTIKTYMSDELFNPVADLTGLADQAPAAGAPPAGAAPVDRSGDVTLLPTTQLAPSESTIDAAIADIPSGVDQQFGAGGFALPAHTRTIAAARPPSALALLLGLLGFPAAVVALVIVAVRRRRVFVA